MRTVAALVLTLLPAAVFAPPASARRAVPQKAAVPGLQTVDPTGRIVVKFTEASGVRVRGTELTSAGAGDAGRVSARLARAAPGARWSERFGRSAGAIASLRAAAAGRSGDLLPDLGTYAVLSGLPDTGRDALIETLRLVLDDPAVETAFLEPVVTSLGVSGALTAHAAPASAAGTTPDFTALQSYRGPAPIGVGTTGMALVPGADGSGVKVIDIEQAWLWTHEDLPAPFVEIGTQSTNAGLRNHGTAVMGVIRGTDNGFGITGLAPACSVGGAATGELSVAECLLLAAAELDRGDVISIEVAAAGPFRTTFPVGQVPMEFWQDVFDAIQLVTASGIIVCEGAGNGLQNLDDPGYAGLFDPAVRHSGALMVGASVDSTLDPLFLSNSGARVDLHAWGGSVVTSGFSSLQGLPFPPEQWYTDDFNATSAATAIVTGAVASLQGATKAAFGFPLDAALMGLVLKSTGTPQNPGPHVGPRPNLPAAWTILSFGVARFEGTVTEAGTGTPIEGATVRVLQTGAATRTDASGFYALTVFGGEYTLRFDSFRHESLLVQTGVLGGAMQVDGALTPKPTVQLVARAWDHAAFAPLPGVRVRAFDPPLGSGITGPDGTYDFGDVPGGYTYRLMFEGVPEYGAAYREVPIPASPPGGTVQDVPGWLAANVEDFEANDGGFVADSLWTRGTPQAGGPPSAFSGTNCWGVGMTGDYPNDVGASLTSPSYDFSNPQPPALFLSLHYWCDTEKNYDGVALEQLIGGMWTARQPLEAYTDAYMSGLDDGSPTGSSGGWSGHNGEWRGAVFDMTGYASSSIQFRLRFGSDGGITGPGFWIDDVAWDTGADLTNDVETSGPASSVALAIFPNPARSGAVLAWRGLASGPSTVAIHDVRGRRIRTLADSAHLPPSATLLWDGVDDRGTRAPQGVYWVRVSQEGRHVASRRLVIAR